MNEIQIAVDLSPFLFSIVVRLICLAIGITAFIHFTIMGAGLSNKVSWTCAILLAFIVGASVGIIIGSITGDVDLLILSFVGMSGSMILWSLWIWAHGFHMDEFVSRILRHK